ncbi:MAG: extracellular solute-binding protein [Rectinemataceae bacterium]|nr:extracellular solute-binding protein [Rectinemataceae bacterium]
MKKQRFMLAALAVFMVVCTMFAGAANPKVRFVLKDLDTDPNGAKFISLIEKGMAEAGTPVDIELMKVPAGNYAEKISLMIMSGDVPDLIYFQGGDEKLAMQDILADMRPLVAKSKYFKGLMDAHSVTRLENYPYIVWIAPPRVRTPVMRRDWYDSLPSAKAVMTAPSVDTYYALFKDLVAKKGTAYGICVTGATNGIEELDAIFDAAFGNTSTWMKGADGKWSFARVSANERNKLEFYAKLYKEGLLDPEYLTKKWDSKEQVFYEGKAGIIPGVAPGSVDVYVNKMMKAQGTDLVSLPPAKGKAQGLTPFVDVTKETRGFAIPASSKVKAAAFAVLDFMWSPAGLKLAKLGMPGVHYVDDGKQYILTDKYPEWYNGWFGDSFNGFDPDKPLSRPIMTKAAVEAGALAKKYMMPDKNILIPEQYITNWDAMTNLYKEYTADIVTGKKPISAFDEFVAKWNKAGGVELTAYANKTLK